MCRMFTTDYKPAILDDLFDQFFPNEAPGVGVLSVRSDAHVPLTGTEVSFVQAPCDFLPYMCHHLDILIRI